MRKIFTFFAALLMVLSVSADETVHFNLTGWDNRVANYHYWIYRGETADQSMSIDLTSGYTTQLARSYMYDDMEIGSCSLYIYEDDAEYSFTSLMVEVEVNDDGVITISGEGSAENGVTIIFTCEPFGGPATAISNTAAEIKVQKIIENGQVVIPRDGKKFNLMGAEL